MKRACKIDDFVRLACCIVRGELRNWAIIQ